MIRYMTLAVLQLKWCVGLGNLLGINGNRLRVVLAA